MTDYSKEASIEEYLYEVNTKNMTGIKKVLYMKYIDSCKWIYTENVGPRLFLDANQKTVSYCVRFILEMMTYFETTNPHEAIAMSNRKWMKDSKEQIKNLVAYRLRFPQLALDFENHYEQLRLEADFVKHDATIKSIIRSDDQILDEPYRDILDAPLKKMELKTYSDDEYVIDFSL